MFGLLMVPMVLQAKVCSTDCSTIKPKTTRNNPQMPQNNTPENQPLTYESFNSSTISCGWRLSVAPMLDGSYSIGEAPTLSHSGHTRPTSAILRLAAFAASYRLFTSASMSSRRT